MGIEEEYTRTKPVFVETKTEFIPCKNRTKMPPKMEPSSSVP
jgi:hypothetical protein